MRPSRSPHVCWPDLARVLASQLIVWHHLLFFGPLMVAVRPLAPDLVGWLADDARQVVQVFLVLGGYLAAVRLLPAAGAQAGGPPASPTVPWRQWLTRAKARFLRLAVPLWPALLLALATAWLARWCMADADTPAAPDLRGLLANFTLTQDLLAEPALTAGLWYLAIDLQLYLGLALLAALLAHAPAAWRRPLALAAVAACGAGALWVWNLDPHGDIWAPYFAGSYALGVLAWWIRGLAPRSARLLATLVVAAVVLLALEHAWRSRLVVAGLTALVLAWGRDLWLPRAGLATALQGLARISYGLFLLHYPLSLLVNSLWWWLLGPEGLERPLLALSALLLTWALSLAGGAALTRWVERGAPLPLGARLLPATPRRRRTELASAG
ncbi:acyltransferase family protein [Ideonella livida]|uniref:Acyltransferase family protein n=1 Tax=Ideonella livida TaxID=2707176 RepID=A0A7C9PJY7_9BURK|nr:acyltransferase family protein [Ideonella livida]NDY92874.1 acyltransferase family protein [Ideonella livida]